MSWCGQHRPKPLLHQLRHPESPIAAPTPPAAPHLRPRAAPRAPSPDSTHRTTFLSTSSAQKLPGETRDWDGQSEREEERGGERCGDSTDLFRAPPPALRAGRCSPSVPPPPFSWTRCPLHRRPLTLHAATALLLDALPTAPPAAVSAQKAAEID
jgi:hypothetical protein